ncbi:MAG: hypothetical protein UY05_C0041G0005 [Candidatus Peregrinibacteria bacterium GW2011_GWA2_47_7]|nr:MAG: hypothetical protein UY05_C0041G0005 [Candidatus Peregrinibacteria bacterium GW2011_GWA2_47_7]
MADDNSRTPFSPRRRFHLDRLKGRKQSFKSNYRYNKRRVFEPSRFSHIFLLTKRILTILSLSFIVVGGMYLISFSSFFSIVTIQYFRDNTPVEIAPYAPLVEPYRGRNLIFLNTKEIKREITQQFGTTIESIVIDKKFPATLAFTHLPYPPVLNVRAQSKVNNETVQKRFVINANGVVIENDIEYPDLPFFSATIDTLPPIETQFLPQEITAKIAHAHELFVNTFGMKIIEIIYKEAAREIHLKTEKKFLVWIDLTQDIDRQINKLKRALPKLDMYTASLQYIDLRISGKNTERVIYRKR